MARVEVKTKAPLKPQSDKYLSDLTALMPMATPDITGQLLLSFPNETIIKVSSLMLSEEISEVNDDVLNMAGEITNMVTGGAKALLEEEKHSFNMARPVVYKRSEYEALILTAQTQIVIPFNTSAGPFLLAMGFVHIKG